MVSGGELAYIKSVCHRGRLSSLVVIGNMNYDIIPSIDDLSKLGEKLEDKECRRRNLAQNFS